MKKVIAILVAVLMLASLSCVAFADDEPAGGTPGGESQVVEGGEGELDDQSGEGGEGLPTTGEGTGEGEGGESGEVGGEGQEGQEGTSGEQGGEQAGEGQEQGEGQGQEQGEGNSPQTGDSSIVLWISLAVASLAGAVLVSKKALRK